MIWLFEFLGEWVFDLLVPPKYYYAVLAILFFLAFLIGAAYLMWAAR